jgi:hypothetical protein
MITTYYIHVNGPYIALNIICGGNNEIITQKILYHKPCSLQLLMFAFSNETEHFI